METDVRVSEAMTRKVVTLSPTATANVAAKKMAKANIGSIVVKSDKALGMVTERDICYRVVAKDKTPSKVKIEDIMTTPLKTASPDATLSQASRTMAKHNIRRLPVMENSKLVGIISTKDIIAIAPETITILKELNRMNNESGARHKEVPDKGTCEVCGDYMVSIDEVDGTFVCETCKEEIAGGE